MTSLLSDDQFALKVKEQYDKFSNNLAVFSDSEKTKSVLEPKINRQDRVIAHQRNQIEGLQLELQEIKESNQRASNGWANEHETVEKQHYRIEELETKIETILEAVSNMGKHKQDNK